MKLAKSFYPKSKIFHNIFPFKQFANILFALHFTKNRCAGYNGIIDCSLVKELPHDIIIPETKER
jgi:hypothetical protein